MTISLDSDKIQKRTIPHLKAENLIITVYFMHFLQKITVRVTTDINVCIIFFVTVSSNNFEEIDEADVQILILLVLGLSTVTAYFRLLVAVLRLLQNH